MKYTNKVGPIIRISIYSENNLDEDDKKEIINELNWRYGFNEDLTEFFNKFKEDKFLKEPIKRLRGIRLNCANSLYELLMILIVLQNVTIKRTMQMMNNLLNDYGVKLMFDGKELFAYWLPDKIAQISEENLKALKLGYRAKMIKSISEEFAKGNIEEHAIREMEIEQAKKELTKLYGVGPATAQIIVSEYLRKYDMFDLKGRFWEQKLLSRVLFNKELVPAAKIINLLNKRYGKWQVLAYYYIFSDLFWRNKEKKIDWLEREMRR
jgi:3-methyladenine DNA glycosylase/8-oxoguanine DNA glycosylase